MEPMRRRLFAVALLLLVVGGVLAWYSRQPGVRVETGWLDEVGERIRAQFYLPADGAGPRPGVLLCHGIDSSKEAPASLALAFAARGFVALAFDFGDHGESYARPLRESRNLADVQRALATLANRPEVDRHRLAIVGFSMAVPSALQAAQQNSDVQAVVLMGRAVVAPQSPPRNLLLGAGVFDQFQNPDGLLAALRATTGRSDAVAGERYGSFAEGTARRLVLSPRTDHPLEFWDERLLAEAVGWVEQALLGGSPTPPDTRTTWLPAARSALFAGSVLLLLGILYHVLGWVPGDRLRKPLFRRAVAVLGAGACLAPVLLSSCGVPGDMLLSDAALLAVVVVLGVNLLLYRHAALGQSWGEVPGAAARVPLCLAGSFAAAWLLGSILYRAGYLWHNPDNLCGLPWLAAHMAGCYPDLLLGKLRVLFFTEYSVRLVPSPAWCGCMLLEMILPGEVPGVALHTLEAGWRRLRGRRNVEGGPPALPVSRSTRLMQVALGVGLVAMQARSVLRVKPLDGPATRSVALEFAGFMLTVLVVFVSLLLLCRRKRGCSPSP
jgi:Esterase FrsA-like